MICLKLSMLRTKWNYFIILLAVLLLVVTFDEGPNDEIFVNFLFEGQENEAALMHFPRGLDERWTHGFELTVFDFNSSFFGFIAFDKSILRDRSVRIGVFAMVSERRILVLVSCSDFCL